ncbi:MAG TPA: hypothetical protein VK465_15375, partial [Fibrobacteria bacterium]|nr:hypothetical protein [Fibrobacteria bacterium]
MSRIHILCLLLAATALWGCTAPEENDNPFTRFRGEVFQSLQLEVDTGGDLLVMTGLGMIYEYQGKDSAQVGSTRTRNYHSVLYRRTKGSWSATPFRNISDGLFYLPSLVSDAEGRYHAFIKDAEKILRYRYEGSEWVRAEADRHESTQGVILGGSESHLRTIAPKNDSGVVFCLRTREEGVEVHGVAGGGGSFILDTNQSTGITEIRAMPGFIGVLGDKHALNGEETWKGANRWLPAYWYWHPDDSVATAVILPGSNIEQVRFASYRNGLGIFMVLPDGFYLQPLSSDGTPEERIFLAERNFRQMALDTVMDDASKSAEAPEWNTRPQSFSQVEVDAKGCVHTLLTQQPYWTFDKEGNMNYVSGLFYANSCSQRREEEIPLPTNGPGDPWVENHAANMHIDAEDKVRVAILQHAGIMYADVSYTYAPSRLLIAELGKEGWTT